MSQLECIERRVSQSKDPVDMREAIVEALALASGCTSLVLARPYNCSGIDGVTDVHSRGVKLDELVRLACGAEPDHAVMVERLLTMKEADCRPRVASSTLLAAPTRGAAAPHASRASEARVVWVVRPAQLLGVVELIVEPRAAEHAVRAVSAVAGWATATLRRAARLEATAQPIDLVCNATGDVLLGAPQSEVWTSEPIRRERLRDWVKVASEGMADRWPGIAGMAVSVSAMEAVEGSSPVWLVRLAPVSPAAREGRHLLTKRQLEVAECAVIGQQNSEIARELNMSDGTVKVHLRAAYRALGVSSRAELSRGLSARLRS